MGYAFCVWLSVLVACELHIILVSVCRNAKKEAQVDGNDNDYPPSARGRITCMKLMFQDLTALDPLTFPTGEVGKQNLL